MRVLAFSWAVSDHRGGGEPIGAYELVRHLAYEGVEVDLVTPTAEIRQALPAPTRLHETEPDVRRGMSGLNKHRMQRKGRDLLARDRYDVVHVVSQFTSWPVLARPLVMSGCYRPEGGPPPGPRAHVAELAKLKGPDLASKLAEMALSAWKERVRGQDLEWTLRNVDHIVMRQGAGVAPYSAFAPTTFIPFGVDTARFTPDERVEKEPLVVFAGNFLDYKRPLHLVEALGLLKADGVDFRAVLCGSGPLQEPARTRAAALRLGDRVDFPGHYPRERIVDLFRRASAFCLPSWFEPGGLVNLEAMACGTAPVTTRTIVGARDYVQDGVNGYLVEKDDVRQLADRLAALVTDRTRARDMGRAARKTAEQFSWREVARRHVLLYETLAR